MKVINIVGIVACIFFAALGLILVNNWAKSEPEREAEKATKSRVEQLQKRFAE